MEKSCFDALMSSLEDAAAFAEGDTSRCRVVEFEAPVPERRLLYLIDNDHSLVDRLACL